MGNWLRLCFALSVGNEPYKQTWWILAVLKYSKAALMIFILSFSIFTLSSTIIYCGEVLPIWISISIEIIQLCVLIVAVVVGPLILKLLKRSSKYLYQKTKFRV